MNKLNKIKRLGIIAGGGELPSLLASECKKNNIVPVVIGLKGQIDENLDVSTSVALGSAGGLFRALKKNDVEDVVLIGSVRRPSLSEVRPDFKAIKILSSVNFWRLGDDGLLRALKKIFENEGFKIHPVQEFMPRLLAPLGVITKTKPSESHLKDIEKGKTIVKTLGSLDVGQCAIIQNGVVLGLEGAEGTTNLIRRCKDLHKKGTGGILVKLSKPNQDKALDMPTIGVDTISAAAESGLSGIAIEAGSTLITNIDDVISAANKSDIFVTGISAQ